MTLEKQHYILMRRTLGVLIIALPIITILDSLLGAHFGLNPKIWYHSISTTYYTNANGIMVSIIAIASFFFVSYPGYDWKDRLVNSISGFGLFGLILFPCNVQEYIDMRVGAFCLLNQTSGLIHDFFALSAFLGFFINVAFLFTKSNGEKTKKKRIRNIIYYATSFCIIPVALAFIVLNILGVGTNNMIWIAEIIALIPCGFAWLVKGETFRVLND